MIYINYTIAMTTTYLSFLRHFDFNFFGLKLSFGLMIAIYMLRCIVSRRTVELLYFSETDTCYEKVGYMILYNIMIVLNCRQRKKKHDPTRSCMRETD